MKQAAAAVLLVLAAAGVPAGQQEEGNRPIDPFQIAGPLYYVGPSDIGSYLITPAGSPH